MLKHYNCQSVTDDAEIQFDIKENESIDETVVQLEPGHIVSAKVSGDMSRVGQGHGRTMSVLHLQGKTVR